MPPISVMIKPASGNCNMKCEYCFYCDEAEKRSHRSYGLMDTETLRNVMRRMILHAEGSCSIAFQGGEPSLAGLEFFRKAVEYGRYYNRKGIRVQYAFQTNGTNITEEWCRFFRENNFLVGVSLDGTRELHDKYRRTAGGGATWEKITENIEMMEHLGVAFNILTVVHRETAEHIREIYEFYREKNWNYQQYIACLDPLYEKPGQRGYSLAPELYGRFLEELFDCWYQDYRRGCQPYIRQFENYIAAILGYMPESCEQRGCCGIQYVVEADGGVYPCDFYMLDEYLLGNINTDTIAVLDGRRRSIGFLERSRGLPDECRSCRFLRVCRNGCMRSRGDGGRNYFCEGYRRFFEKAAERLHEIARDSRLTF